MAKVSVVTNFSGAVGSMGVVTHPGIFHADEITAIAILSMVRDDDQLEIIRTRDPEIIASASCVVDVGGVYMPSENRFDHHQSRGGQDAHPIHGETRRLGCSSAGLVWAEWGPVMVRNVIGDRPSNEIVKAITDIVYATMIADVDAIDVGNRRPEKGEFTYSHVVSSYNDDDYNPGDAGDFEKAVGFATQILYNQIRYAYKLAMDQEKVKAVIAGREGAMIMASKAVSQ